MICKYIFLQYRIDTDFIFIIFGELYTIDNKKNIIIDNTLKA